MIHPERVQLLNGKKEQRGRYVLYWMQSAVRSRCNHALEYALRAANARGVPLLACFGLTPDFPEANARHYAFLLEGLREAGRALEKKGVRLVIRLGDPASEAAVLAREASLAVVDRGYTRPLVEWRARAAKAMGCPLLQVETDAVVPVEAASPREEFSAATLRPKISKRLKEFLRPLKESRAKKDSLGLRLESFSVEDVPKALKALEADMSVPPAPGFRGGEREAQKRLDAFAAEKLARYAADKNDPSLGATSGLGPYLHFGHVSPLEIALRLQDRRGKGRNAFLEELIVRRELSLNFIRYNRRYDRFHGLPDWCRKTLIEHERDPRPHLYSLDELERGRTHDPYWNAAQDEMVLTGRMHGYMRMYWGKMILEWSPTPEEAFARALYLNNKYELDGRDPNGYAGVAWCFGKHDRPWGERPVFGKVRCMVAQGLRRKFDIEGYVQQVDALRAAPKPRKIR